MINEYTPKPGGTISAQLCFSSMQTTFYAANERGRADYGWLKANYSFSFANYYNPQRVHFGKLRVLNDDIIQGGAGFPTHPHENMEIVTIPLKGGLKHEDSTGGKGVIRPGEVQAMSAGSGIEHSEFNYLKNAPTNVLQLWIFPKERNIEPSYRQQFFDAHQRKNKWQIVVSPKHQQALDINQNAVLSMTELDKGSQLTYEKHFDDNGLFLFNIDGSVSLKDTELNKRDAFGIEEFETVEITALENATLLAIEVPMN